MSNRENKAFVKVMNSFSQTQWFEQYYDDSKLCSSCKGGGLEFVKGQAPDLEVNLVYQTSKYNGKISEGELSYDLQKSILKVKYNWSNLSGRGIAQAIIQIEYNLDQQLRILSKKIIFEGDKRKFIGSVQVDSSEKDQLKSFVSFLYGIEYIVDNKGNIAPFFFWKDCNLENEFSFRVKSANDQAPDSPKWILYEGVDENKKKIQSFGNTFLTLPTPLYTTNYSVCPEGFPTLCKSFSVNIMGAPALPDTIKMTASFVCEGNPVKLTFNQQTDSFMSINWYFKKEDQISSQWISNQESVIHKPGTSGKYEAKIKHICGLETVLYANVEVEKKPNALAINSDFNEGWFLNNKVSSNDLNGYQLNWYADERRTNLIGSGQSLSIRKKKVKEIYLFAEKNCGPILVGKSSLYWNRSWPVEYYFLNISLPSSDFRRFRSLQLTAGSEQFYFRFRLGFNLFKGYDYKAANNRITNYPANTNTYYQFTDRFDRRRNSVSAGVLFPHHSKNFKFYSGLGYGSNTVFWNANIFRYYSNDFVRNSWVKNTEFSMRTLQLETGFQINLFEKINLMYGYNLLIGRKKLFSDMSVGIGISAFDY